MKKRALPKGGRGTAAPVLPDEPKGWRKLHEKAQRERDPQKLAQLIDQMNQLLMEYEKKAALKKTLDRIRRADRA